MLDFNLEYCRAFYYVARLGSTTKAAAALYLTQPAISHSIQRLEEHLALPLFLRTAKGMALTAEGEELFRHVSAAFESLLTGEQRLLQQRSFSEGTLRIAATETPLYGFLLPHIKSFKAQHPGIHLHVTGSSSAEALRLLREGNADVAFAVTPLQPGGDVQATGGKAFQDVFVAGPGYGHLRGRPLTLQQLCAQPLIAVEPGTSARSLIDKWFAEGGVFFQPEYSVRTSTTVLPFVQAGLGIGIVPALFAAPLVQAGELFLLETEKPLYTRHIVTLCGKGQPPSPLCARFLQHIQGQRTPEGTPA